MDEPIKKMKTGEKRNHSSISTTTTDDNYNLMILLFMSRLINLNTESIILQIENGKTLCSKLFSSETEAISFANNFAMERHRENQSSQNFPSNAIDYDEIPLHKSGHAPNGRYINLRTLRGLSGVLKLQIICNVATSGASNYIFKFRRMI